MPAKTAKTAKTSEAFPSPVRANVSNGTRKGATGPRYTDKQIQRAIAMKLAGKTWKEIGAALNIKATAYLAKLLKPEVAKATKKVGAVKPKRRVVRRSTSAAK